MTTRIHLIRHAHSDWTPDDARPLSTRGRAGALSVADALGASSIAAVYSSPARRALETVEPLAARLGLAPVVLPDLREREMPALAADDFEAYVRASWLDAHETAAGAEPMIEAQARGLRAVEAILARHPGESVAVATHGNLLALVANAFDAACGYDFWRALAFPDVYALDFTGDLFEGLQRVAPAGSG